LYLVDPEARRVDPVGSVPEGAASALGPLDAGQLAAVRSAVARLGPAYALAAAEPDLLDDLAGAGLPTIPADLSELRRARELLPARPFAAVRSFLLGEARRRLADALASPEESLIALAREEERVERALIREEGAADQWVSAETGPLAEYAAQWGEFRESLRGHHRRLEGQLDAAARRCVPNLTALLGPRVAGRLVAAAGGVQPLARMSSSRLQLLGTRRRPGGNRGPKYGIMARAVHGVDVPLGRTGALARSLSALAAIAVRADASTHADLSKLLLARRDRRMERLRGGLPR
jgi:hypothetical protein